MHGYLKAVVPVFYRRRYEIMGKSVVVYSGFEVIQEIDLKKNVGFFLVGSQKVIQRITMNVLDNLGQSMIPFYNRFQYRGCSTVGQLVAYEVLHKMALLNPKVIAIILLFL
jgi:hypothetical protein